MKFSAADLARDVERRSKFKEHDLVVIKATGHTCLVHEVALDYDFGPGIDSCRYKLSNGNHYWGEELKFDWEA